MLFDRREYQVQMSGIADGLRDPIVSDALVRGRAALSLVQWAGHGRQGLVVGWQRMHSAADVAGFAARVERADRLAAGSATAIGEALEFTTAAFTGAPACSRRVIDISGDGRSNEGVAPHLRRAHAVQAGVTVNALVIDTRGDGLTDYFLQNVISGAQSFAITAASVDEFAGKMRLKLYRELAIGLVALPPDMRRHAQRDLPRTPRCARCRMMAELTVD